jgi:penicillin-binding protein 1A
MRRFAIILLKSVAVLLLVCFAASVAFAGWVSWYYSARLDLPTVEKLVAVSPADRICSSGGDRVYAPLAAIPLRVRNAVLAVEEPDFYHRRSILVELAGAVLLEHKPPRAGISVVVTRCLMSLSTRCCKSQADSHIGHFILVKRVYSSLSRDRIFEIYLNETHFGRGAYGVGAAAIAFFGKPVADLTIDEAANLAVLPKAPNIYLRNTERWTERRNFIIDRMQAAGFINASEAAAAKQQPLVLRPAPAPI